MGEPYRVRDALIAEPSCAGVNNPLTEPYGTNMSTSLAELFSTGGKPPWQSHLIPKGCPDC